MEPYSHHAILMKVVRQLDDATVIVKDSTLCCHREQPRIILAIAGLEPMWLAANNHPSVSQENAHLQFVLQFGGSGQRFELDLTSETEVRQGRYCFPEEDVPWLADILGNWIATARNTYARIKSPYREHEDWDTLEQEAES